WSAATGWLANKMPKPLAQSASASNRTTPSPLAQPLPDSPSRKRWENQKKYDGAFNRHIDELMRMTGLESVKKQVLTIRDKIELSRRQAMSMADERFNVSLLGNPGTGT